MSAHSDSDRYSQTGDWLFGAVKRNPEGFLLLAAGCALMMRSGSRPSQRSQIRPGQHHDGDTGNPNSRFGGGFDVGEKVSQAAQTASEYASEMKDRVSDTASAVANFAGEAGRSVSDQSGRFARQARTTAENTFERVLSAQPLAVALVGLAAGAAVAAAFPTSDIEKRALGDAGEKLAEVAGQAGTQLKEASAKAGESLMSAAEERGLTKEGLKEVARDAAGAFGEALSGGQSNSSDQSQGKPAGQFGQSDGSNNTHNETARGVGSASSLERDRQSTASADSSGPNRPSVTLSGAVGRKDKA